MTGYKIAATNFWQGFSIETGLIRLILDSAFGDFSLTESLQDADLVFTGSFGPPERIVPVKDKTIAVIWENWRPDYRVCAYTLSSDFDSYGGRNFRLPYWYGEILWPGLKPNRLSGPPYHHGLEPRIAIETLMEPRQGVPPATTRELFCCFVGTNPELHRRLAVEELASVRRVDLFGAVAGRPLTVSKYEVLTRYRFNLCFENSLFPGYYTEKALHAWVGGCVPLYYADRWFTRDFNAGAVVNRADFATVTDFVRRVAALDRDPAAIAGIAAQPLVVRRPSLDPVIAFVRQAAKAIVSKAPRRMWPAAGSVGPGAMPG